ncbi:glycoprotein 3-alpha-L-fucosyltransferase A-like [Acanthaster planci]|uniref:Fucosyltransferase n=1 Tax=Acanthaster planci TaxID=133434 RepID=A0A8B7ZYX1_ACAPL|nr:glycoprotein 3-alpha-L-fucosyltransferase A-like [Acanthaster planci]
MAPYRLRMHHIPVFFAITISLTWLIVNNVLPVVFPPWEWDKRGSIAQRVRNESQGQENHGVTVVEQGISNQHGNRPEFGHNRGGNVHTAPRCNTTVAILLQSLLPGLDWREYKQFVDQFKQHSAQFKSGEKLKSLHLKCPRQKCDVHVLVTVEARYLNGSDAIIVNMHPLHMKEKHPKLLPHLREVLNPKIHWFFYGVESPQMMTFWDQSVGEILYHHSITYHSEADIELLAAKYSPNHPERVTSTERDWSASKTGMIAWMASNCKYTFWPRLEFVSELKRYVPVDIFGKCGSAQCFPVFDAFAKNCTRVMERYKFYLSLENSECDEYITRKVWENALAAGAVPVVYGGRKETYQRLLPPKSFIHIGDFNSIEALAAYLQLLHSNNSLYNTYHAWRKFGRLETGQYPPLDSQLFCKVVPFTAAPPPQFKVVKNSGYFKGCRSLPGVFAKKASLKSFVPWK